MSERYLMPPVSKDEYERAKISLSLIAGQNVEVGSYIWNDAMWDKYTIERYEKENGISGNKAT